MYAFFCRSTRLFAAALVLLLSVLVPAAANAAGATVTVAQGVDTSTLDPHLSNDTPTTNIVDNIFDSLLRRDNNMQLQPALAAEYRQIDPLTWEFTCREDVFFHNGEPFDANAAKFSIERVLDPAFKSPQASRIQAIKTVEAIDARTLRITTELPYPLLPAQLATIAMVPPDYLRRLGSRGFAQAPVGTGPFKFKEWQKDEQVVLEANPSYYRGAPQIARAIFRPIPETATRIAELKTGAVDLVVNVPPHQVKSVEAVQGLTVRTAPSGRIVFLILTTTEGGPLADPRVRRALNYAIDKKAIIDALLEGYGKELSIPMPADTFGVDQALKPYPYNPQKAKQLLAEAGYPNGFPIAFESPSGRYLMDKDVAQAVQGFLQAVGVTPEFEILEWGVFVNKLYQHSGALIMLLGWGSSTFDADGYLYGLLRTGQLSAYHSDPSLDQLLDAARTETDAVKREALYKKAQKKIYDDSPIIPLYQQIDIYAASEHLVWQPRADERILIYEMGVK